MIENIIGFADWIFLSLTPILNNIVAALLIVFLGFVIGKLIGNLVQRIIKDAKKTGLKTARKLQRTSTLLQYSIYTVAIILALQSLGILWIVLGFVLLCFVLVLGFSALFTLKDFIPNILAREHVVKKYQVGQKRKIKGVSGTIEHIGVTQLRIRTKSDDLILFPHKEISQKV